MKNIPISDANRRKFLKSAAFAAAPFVLPSGLRAQGTSAPSERIRMGFIGMGKMSRGLLNNFSNQDGVEVMAVCDVDTNRREDAVKVAKKLGSKSCTGMGDFRELVARDDIDAVCIATPDHWHAIQTVAAANAGKDIYCEKPLTHNVMESRAVMEAVPRNGRILQTGSMQRSMSEFYTAAMAVRNGVIGDIKKVTCNFGAASRPYDLEAQEKDPGLDWDMWCGPAPLVNYNEAICPRGVHEKFPDWRDYMEFCNGRLGDFAAHHVDIVQWALDMDSSGPVEIIPPKNWKPGYAGRGAYFRYANGIELHHGHGKQVHFFGTEGEIMVSRRKFGLKMGDKMFAQFFSREDRTSLERELRKVENEFLKDPKVKLHKSDHHIQDFLSAVRTRKAPICPEEIGGRSSICCNLFNIAYHHGQKIDWDPAKNDFARGGDQAWLTRDYRGDWKV